MLVCLSVHVFGLSFVLLVWFAFFIPVFTDHECSDMYVVSCVLCAFVYIQLVSNILGPTLKSWKGCQRECPRIVQLH